MLDWIMMMSLEDDIAGAKKLMKEALDSEFYGDGAQLLLDRGLYRPEIAKTFMPPTMSIPGEFFGIKFVSCDYLVERKQVKFPRSKKRRIRKKWAKQSKNWINVPKPYAFEIMSDTYVAHPTLIESVKDRIRMKYGFRYER